MNKIDKNLHATGRHSGTICMRPVLWIWIWSDLELFAGSGDLQDANKKLIKKTSFSAYYFLKVHLHHFSKINSPKEVTKQ
jgi:hypothetical protein